MKKSIIIFIILSFILSIFLGLYIYKISNIQEDTQKIAEIEEEKLVNDECTLLEELNSVNANFQENKTSPTTNLTIRIFYKQCNHLVETTEKISDKESINLTEEEFKQKYNDWEIQRFTSSEIIIYKEVDDYCNEHYIIGEQDGCVAVYKIDKDGEEKINKLTDISINYLTNEDVEKIKKGIMVYSKKELNKTLEDFE